MAFLAVNKMEISVKFALWTLKPALFTSMCVYIHACTRAGIQILECLELGACLLFVCARFYPFAHLMPHAVCVPVVLPTLLLNGSPICLHQKSCMRRMLSCGPGSSTKLMMCLLLDKVCVRASAHTSVFV